MDVADEETGDAVGVEGADEYECSRSTKAVETSRTEVVLTHGKRKNRHGAHSTRKMLNREPRL